MTPKSEEVMVRLSGPAKIGSKWRKAGDEIPVDPETAKQLRKSGLLDLEAPDLSDLATGMPGFDEAVGAAARDIARETVAAAVEKAMAEHRSDLAAARARAEEAEAEVRSLQARNNELELHVAELTAAATDASAKTGASDADPGTSETAQPVAVAGRKGAKPTG